MPIFTTTFIADGSGGSISFVPQNDNEITVDNVTLRQVITPASDENASVKEFLTGTADDGREIFFRADTQVLQIQSSPELYSSPLAIASETERGSMMRVFVSLDEKPFYQLEGTVTKGVSVLKFNAPNNNIVKPPLIQTIQVSYRDSSFQLCRIIQSGIITIPTPIDLSQ